MVSQYEGVPTLFVLYYHTVTREARPIAKYCSSSWIHIFSPSHASLVVRLCLYLPRAVLPSQRPLVDSGVTM